MEYEQNDLPAYSRKSYSQEDDLLRNFSPDPLFCAFDYSSMSFEADRDRVFPDFTTSINPSDHHSYNLSRISQNTELENESDFTNSMNNMTGPQCNLRAVLSNLASLEQRIHDVQDVVRSIMEIQGHLPIHHDELAAQRQLVTADVTSIVTQLISTAGSLLPSVLNAAVSTNPSAGQLENITDRPTEPGASSNLAANKAILVERNNSLNHDDVNDALNFVAEEAETIPIDEYDMKEIEDGGECENLPPGTYELLQLEKEEILAPHTHFCQICGKGFKRDANLRMHMRGHGDEYKTLAALAKPPKDSNSGSNVIKRYSCPFVGCKRNKEHKKFLPLKTLLCVKNHYKRTHCDKRHTCSRCNNKKFSVLADLKTHEKHCGRDKWLCSCGTTFSRKDKLFGHIALFQGHTPALPVDDIKTSGIRSLAKKTETMDSVEGAGFSFGCNSSDADFLDVKAVNEETSFFQFMGFDPSSLSGFHEFPQPSFETSDSLYPSTAMVPGSHYQRNGADSSSNQMR